MHQDINNKLKIRLFKNQPIAEAIYTQTRSPEHRRSFKESIAYRQVLSDKRIYFTNFEFETQINTIKDQLVFFLRNKIKVKKHHAFHYHSLITGHFQT